MRRDEMFHKYLEHADAYVNWQKLKNGQDPDEVFMRSVETRAGVSEQAKKHFREDIMIQLFRHLRKGWRFTWESNIILKSAFEGVNP